MRVEPSNTPAAIPQPPPNASVRPAGRATESSSSPLEGAAFALTAQLAQLLATVKSLPEVRAEVIEAVAARLEAGELSTPEAAAETAKALVDSAD